MDSRDARIRYDLPIRFSAIAINAAYSYAYSNDSSGKTVLASVIIDEARSVDNVNTLYFYFRSSDPQKQTFVAMARAFLSQILRLDSSVVSPLYETVLSEADPSLTTRKLAESLLEIGLKDLERTYIIVDGLDECSNSEQKAICVWLRKFADNTHTSLQESNRCVILSQYDSSTRALLSTVPTIGILHTDTAADIEAYCDSWKSLFTSKFKGMDDGEFLGVARTTSDCAKGWFEDRTHGQQ